MKTMFTALLAVAAFAALADAIKDCYPCKGVIGTCEDNGECVEVQVVAETSKINCLCIRNAESYKSGTCLSKAGATNPSDKDVKTKGTRKNPNFESGSCPYGH